MYFGDNFDDVESAVVGLEQASTTYDPGPLELEKTYYWRVDEFDGVETHKGDTLSFTTIGARGTGLRGDYYTGENFDKLELTRIDPQVDFGWGGSPPNEKVGGSNISIRWTGDVSAQFTDTYTFYTITDDGIRVWVNGKLIIENWTHHGDTEDTGTIDLVAGQSYSIVLEYFQAGGGSVARLGWESPHTTKQIIPTYLLWPPIKARNPNPPNGATDIKQTATLSWEPGEAAVSHQSYFGTDEEAVKNANTGSPEYKGGIDLGSESYDPGKLEWDTAYYWRIDEVETDDTIQTGNVWSFTTADFLIVDDFEDYDAYNQIWWSWHDGAGYVSHPTESPYAGNGTGSMVGDENTPSYTEETIVHGGSQSMPVFYDNSVLLYSEVEKTLTYPRDWTENGVNTLTIWFRGSSANATETLYVALNGSAVVSYDNPDAAQIGIWTEWTIDLQAFADQGVNLTNVDKITLGLGDRNNPQAGGSGTMYFDDIRLYPPPEPAP